MKPLVGEMAPDFSAEVVRPGVLESETVRLSELRGRRVVLVFYPKDSTPGCTTQACALRDGWADLQEQAEIFGVSIDGVASHRKFITKQELPYPLIADSDRSLVEAYGVWVEKSMYGKTFMGTERTTFVIGVEGSIEAVLEKVKPKAHFDELKSALGVSS
ncbi:MAG: peroxiredoxin [Verrucomicrobiales bacterium]